MTMLRQNTTLGMLSSTYALDWDLQRSVLSSGNRPYWPIGNRAVPYGEWGYTWPYGMSIGGANGYSQLSWDSFDPLLVATFPSGESPWFHISGVTRDTNSATLGTCVVQLIHTSDDLFVQQTTSDPVGNYDLYTPYNDGHYIVAYKAGSPDVAGTSVNTITGS